MEIYNLIDYLKRCPDIFLTGVVKDYKGSVDTDVLIKDIFRRIHGNFNMADSELPSVIRLTRLDENQIISLQVACWFFSYPFFNSKPQLLNRISTFLFKDLLEVSTIVKPIDWIEDEDRGDEFVRLALRGCEILPTGETAEQASDRLDALDSIKRQEVLRQSKQSIDRIMEIRREMAEQKAREAANVYGRE